MLNGKNIILILGNGFDLDLGLPTSYKDFWESDFCPKDYPAQLIRHLNGRWPNNLESVRWYDLENELREYYFRQKEKEISEDIINSEEVSFLKRHNELDLNNGLYQNAIFESLQQKKIINRSSDLFFHFCKYKDDLLKDSVWRDRESLRQIKEGLRKYLRSISKPKNNSNAVANYVFRSVAARSDNLINLEIFSFNYTDLNYIMNTGLRVEVNYVHGNCDKNNIILGTGDILDLDERYDFMQKSFDIDYNPPSLESVINSSEEIIFFGHSLGDNDKQYFKRFFCNQIGLNNSQKKTITFFTKDDESEHKLRRSLQLLTDGNLSALFSHNELTFIKTDCIEKDQKKLFDFLTKFSCDEWTASSIIRNLLKNNKS